MYVVLLVLVCTLRAFRTVAVQLVAPRCGGTRLVKHASAHFGRQLSPGKAMPILAFAPYPASTGSGVETVTVVAQFALADLCCMLTVSEAAQTRNAVVFELRGGCDFVRKVALA